MGQSTRPTVSRRLPGWAPALGVLLAFGLLGPYIGAASRPLFVVASGAVGWFAWRRGPAAHVKATLLLFVFTPLVRRLVDATAGFDTSSLMIVGPLVAILPALTGAFAALNAPAVTRRMGPLAMVAACVAYAAALTILQGEWMSVARDGVKWLVPLFYALVLMDVADQEEMLDAISDAFAWILPVIGIYGIAQYVNPSDWDSYWMKNSPILSAGYPEPYAVRVFSTMNGPASFATFTAVGLLLVWFRDRGALFRILAIPAVLALFLSLYRTAWISMLAAMLFCAFFKATRGRSIPLFLGLAAIVVVAATLTPFGETISDRLATLSEGSKDGSARERLEEYVTLWNAPDSSLFGIGFVITDVGSAGAMPVDGTIVACWLYMGIVFGLLCLFGLVWAVAEAIGAAVREGSASSVLLGALGLFFLVELPLAGIAAGEAGYLFWMFMGLAMIPDPSFRETTLRAPSAKLTREWSQTDGSHPFG
jgi:hypothetical protein